MRRVVGIDLAITAESRACIADATGEVIAERGFHVRRHELEALFDAATEGMVGDDELFVVMEPTSSMWIAPTAFFRSKGARVHLVPPEQSADLRRYYTKHVKNDRIDAKLLARLPLLHPEGLHEAQVPAGSQGVLKRIVQRRARLVSELGQHRQRVRSILHHAMPGMNDVLGEQLGKAAMALLGRYGSPKAMLRLGKARMAALLIKHSRGAWREAKAEQIVAVARSAIELWDGLEGCDFDEIAEDLACEARIIKTLETEIRELDARAAGLLDEIDPQGLFMSMPGFGERTATTVAGRLGDARRFRNAAAVRAFIGMIPATDQSGEAEAHPRLTKSGDRLLRTALFLAADTARKEDPQLAAIYLRQLDKGSHHTKALCAVATALASRLAAVLREGRRYEIRDTDGTVVDTESAKAIVRERFKVSSELRATRRQTPLSKRQKGRHLDGVRSKAKPSPPAETAPAGHAISVPRSA
jgi:transposase